MVIDVVEGTAIASLGHMHAILDKRPSRFRSYKDAITWSLHSGTVRNPQAANVSIPSQLTQLEDGSLTWRTDLQSSSQYWRDWFMGLSEQFISLSVAKILVLAGSFSLCCSHVMGLGLTAHLYLTKQHRLGSSRHSTRARADDGEIRAPPSLWLGPRDPGGLPRPGGHSHQGVLLSLRALSQRHHLRRRRRGDASILACATTRERDPRSQTCKSAWHDPTLITRCCTVPMTPSNDPLCVYHKHKIAFFVYCVSIRRSQTYTGEASI